MFGDQITTRGKKLENRGVFVFGKGNPINTVHRLEKGFETKTEHPKKLKKIKIIEV